MNCNCGKSKNLLELGIDTSLIDPYIVKFNEALAEANIIEILQKAQALYGYLPKEILIYIAEKASVKLAKIMGVVTFYTQFRLRPVGKHLILLCQGTACHVNGSGAIEEAISEFLHIKDGEISADGLFTYTNVACLGCCSLAPAFMIGDKTYGNLTKVSAVNILKEIQKGEAK